MASIEVRAVAKNVRGSPRKAGLVADVIRGKSVNEALAILRFMPQRATTPVLKAVKSAAANAENTFDLDPAELYVVRVIADPGRTLRRYRPKARGRMGPLRKRTSHVTVVVGEKGA